MPDAGHGDDVVLDDLGAHKMDGVHEAIEVTRAKLHFLPPYSSDLNSIEKC